MVFVSLFLLPTSMTNAADKRAKNNSGNFINDLLRSFISELTLATRQNRAYHVNSCFILFLALVRSIARSVIRIHTRNTRTRA